MEFTKLLKIVGDEPVFESGLLLVGDVDQANIRRQLSRWVNSGRIIQLRRGLYSLAAPYQKVKPHPFVVGNQIQRPSFISLQSALAYHGLIPESVAITTSVTTARPGRWKTALGDYSYRHVKRDLFFGYVLINVGDGQKAFVAAPEKALLDMIYLQTQGDAWEYLRQLRLQHLELLDLDRLRRMTERTGKPKLRRAFSRIEELVLAEIEGFETI